MIGNETFTGNPVSLGISRSKFHFCPVNTGTFVTGKLVPFYMNSLILPGTTVKCDLRTLVRGSTPIAVPADNAYLDTFFFFVPHKLVLDRKSMSPDVNDSNHSWAAFVGAQDNLLNMPVPGDVSLPGMVVGGVDTPVVGGFWDWTGQTMVKVSNGAIVRVNPLTFMAYCKVWNDYFRDPNGSMNPVTFDISGGTVFTHGGPTGWKGSNEQYVREFDLLPTCRFHGYFGSALPWPQRNSDTVMIPLGDKAPLLAGSIYDMAQDSSYTPGSILLSGKASGGAVDSNNIYGNSGSSTEIKSSLYADLSQAAATSVNTFRRLVQEQRWFEALARSGNNTLAELTAGMFNVTPSDAVSNRAELLGAKRIPLNIIQVNNTAGNNVSTSTQSSLGSTGSFSLTSDDSFMFSKSFDTWGTLIGVAVVRVDDTFSQGIERSYTKFQRFDYYWPQFANLGEQPILNREIYALGDYDDGVFGYQEAWAEYRHAFNHVCGLIRPGQSLGYWTYANNFKNRPTLPGFLDASKQVSNVDQTLQVQSSASGFQWIGQFATDLTVVQPLPTYSIPGLVDHH